MPSAFNPSMIWEKIMWFSQPSSRNWGVMRNSSGGCDYWWVNLVNPWLSVCYAFLRFRRAVAKVRVQNILSSHNLEFESIFQFAESYLIRRSLRNTTRCRILAYNHHNALANAPVCLSFVSTTFDARGWTIRKTFLLIVVLTFAQYGTRYQYVELCPYECTLS